MNKVVILTKGGKAGKNNQPTEEQRVETMEKALKAWGVNKGVWLTEMRVKSKIEKVQPLKHVTPAAGKEEGGAGVADQE